MSKRKPDYQHSDYLSRLVPTASLKKTISLCKRALKNKNFDAIAFRGLSGTLVGPAVVVGMNKTMLAVRKRDDNSHSDMMVEGDKGAKHYIIIDDFINSGSTVRAIRKEVKKFAPQAKCVGVLEVNNLWWAYNAKKDIENFGLKTSGLGF